MRDLSLSSSQRFFINSFKKDKKLEEVYKKEFYQLYQYGIEPNELLSSLKEQLSNLNQKCSTLYKTFIEKNKKFIQTKTKFSDHFLQENKDIKNSLKSANPLEKVSLNLYQNNINRKFPKRYNEIIKSQETVLEKSETSLTQHFQDMIRIVQLYEEIYLINYLRQEFIYEQIIYKDNQFTLLSNSKSLSWSVLPVTWLNLTHVAFPEIWGENVLLFLQSLVQQDSPSLITLATRGEIISFNRKFRPIHGQYNFEKPDKKINYSLANWKSFVRQ